MAAAKHVLVMAQCPGCGVERAARRDNLARSGGRCRACASTAQRTGTGVWATCPVCGVERTVRSDIFKRTGGRCRSCAHVGHAPAGKTHGESWGSARTVEYTAWVAMKKRCYLQNHRNYKYYGGRGITVCDRWRDSFENFLADVGRKSSPRLSLDRIDNNGNYEPGNVRWATKSEQLLNRRAPRLYLLQREVTPC